MLYDLGTINFRELAEHLGAADPRTAGAVAEDMQLPFSRVSKKAQAYIAWADVFRCLHRIEPAHHQDILTELKEPLIRIHQIASAFGLTPEALKRREARGRIVLPAPALTIKSSIRLWRPRDVRAWQVGEAVTVYRQVGDVALPVVETAIAGTERPAGQRAAHALGLRGLPTVGRREADNHALSGTASAPA